MHTDTCHVNRRANTIAKHVTEQSNVRCNAWMKGKGRVCNAWAMPNGKCYYHGGATPKWTPEHRIVVMEARKASRIKRLAEKMAREGIEGTPPPEPDSV